MKKTNLQDSKEKIATDADENVNILNDRIDITNSKLAAVQVSLQTPPSSVSECLEEVAAL